MWCPVALHKHTTFETSRLWLLMFPKCRLAVVCISSAVPLDKVVCFFYQGTEVVMKSIWFDFFDLNAWSLDALLYFDRECVLETVTEMFSVHRCIHVCPVITASSLLWWRTIIKSRATKAPFFSCYNGGRAQWSWLKKLSSSLLLPTCFGRIVLLSPNNSFTTIVLFNPFWWQHGGGLWWPTSISHWSGL